MLNAWDRNALKLAWCGQESLNSALLRSPTQSLIFWHKVFESSSYFQKDTHPQTPKIRGAIRAEFNLEMPAVPFRRVSGSRRETPISLSSKKRPSACCADAGFGTDSNGKPDSSSLFH